MNEVTVKVEHATRESWLMGAVAILAPVFAAVGAPLSVAVRVSCGFMGGRGATRCRAIGQCWHPACSADGTAEIFVHPGLSDASDVLAVLVHELVHAAVGNAAGHGPKFRKVALALGLAGKMTATHAGPELAAALERMIAVLGAYPHARLDEGTATRGGKQTTRMLKCACGRCGYTVRVARKWLEIAAPVCPVCEVKLTERQPLEAPGAANRAPPKPPKKKIRNFLFFPSRV